MNILQNVLIKLTSSIIIILLILSNYLLLRRLYFTETIGRALVLFSILCILFSLSLTIGLVMIKIILE